jgi:hypothetical protein
VLGVVSACPPPKGCLSYLLRKPEDFDSCNTLSAFGEVISGRSNSAIVAESKGFIQTDADEPEVEEILPRLEGGPRDHSVSN